MRLLTILILFFFALPALAEPVPSNCQGVQADGNCALYGVSLIELIANPLAYDGKEVEVSGYLVVAFESEGIYLHREDYEYSLGRNGIWVDFSKSAVQPQCKNKTYVHIVGRFNAMNRGHRNAWSGAIENVSRCYSLQYLKPGKEIK